MVGFCFSTLVSCATGACGQNPFLGKRTQCMVLIREPSPSWREKKGLHHHLVAELQSELPSHLAILKDQVPFVT